MSARRAASRRAAKVQRRQVRLGRQGRHSVIRNADRARKRQFCRRFGVSGKRHRALEHVAKRNGVA